MGYIVSPELPRTFVPGEAQKTVFDTVEEAREAIVKALNSYPVTVYTIAEVVETVSASVNVTSTPVK